MKTEKEVKPKRMTYEEITEAVRINFNATTKDARLDTAFSLIRQIVEDATKVSKYSYRDQIGILEEVKQSISYWKFHEMYGKL
jgi:hypothetical protein